MEGPKIDQHISDLLYDYDCVIIPDFGGFVANYKPAWIDDKRHILHPPSKGIIFNKNLINNDGLLANRMVHIEELTYEEANLRIKNTVAEFNELLQNGKRVEIGKVGILYYDFEQNIQFRPDKNTNFYKGAFGLSSIQVKPVKATVVEKEEKQPVIEKVAAEKKTVVIPIQKKEQATTEKKEEKKIAPITKPVVKHVDRPAAKDEPAKKAVKAEVPKQQPVEKTEKVVEVKKLPTKEEEKSGETTSNTRKNKKYLVAAAVFVPIVLYSGWISYKNDFFSSGHVEVSDFNPFTVGPSISGETKYKERTSFPTTFKTEKEANFDEILKELPESTVYFPYKLLDDQEDVIIKVKDDVVAKPVSTDVATTDVAKTVDVNPEINSGLNYHIIGGCFKKKKYAEKLVAKLQDAGYKAYIFDKKNGLHRVSIQSYGSRKMAKKAIKDIKENYVDGAWILKQ